MTNLPLGPPTRLLAQMRQDLLAGVPRYRRRRRRRRVASMGVALLVVVLGGVALADSLTDENGSTTIMIEPGPSSTTVVTVPSLVPSEIVADGLSTSFSTGLFPTDDGLLIVDTENGGSDVQVARWDPDTGRTGVFPPSGLVWRYKPALAWTGTELLMAGGSNGPGIDQAVVAYDPATRQWRQLPDPPGDRATSAPSAGGNPAFWTGTELLIPFSGLALDLSSETWRTIAPSPLTTRAGSGAHVWTGNAFFVWGGCRADAANPPCDESNTNLLGDGALYDLASDSWRLLPPSPLDPAVRLAAGWTGNEVVVAVTEPGAGSNGPTAAAYDPTTDTWRTLPDLPLSSRRYTAAAVADGQLVVWGGLARIAPGAEPFADGALYRPDTNTWSTFTVDPALGRGLSEMAWLDDRLYITGGRPNSVPFTFTLPAQ